MLGFRLRASALSRAFIAAGLSLVVLLTLAAVESAEAQGFAGGDADEFSRPGLYLGVGVIGTAYTLAEDEINDLFPGLPNFEVDEAVGAEVAIGYRFAPHFAVEAEFEYAGVADISFGPFSNVIELESLSATINLKAFLATGRVQPYVLVGGGVMHSKLSASGVPDADATGEAGRFGAGLEIYLTPTWALDFGADYVLPGGDTEDLDYASFGAGLKLRF